MGIRGADLWSASPSGWPEETPSGIPTALSLGSRIGGLTYWRGNQAMGRRANPVQLRLSASGYPLAGKRCRNEESVETVLAAEQTKVMWENAARLLHL